VAASNDGALDHIAALLIIMQTGNIPYIPRWIVECLHSRVDKQFWPDFVSGRGDHFNGFGK
jgi:hypothetical protein